MKTLNECFPNLGNQLNELQAVATEFQKESTLANQSRFQDLVSGLLVDLMAKGIGREVTNNGFFTSFPCAEAVTSKKSESGVHKRTQEGLQSPRTLTKKSKSTRGKLVCFQSLAETEKITRCLWQNRGLCACFIEENVSKNDSRRLKGCCKIIQKIHGKISSFKRLFTVQS